MTTPIKTPFLRLFIAFVLTAAAQLLGHDAKVLKVSGSATVHLPGQPAQPVAVGMSIPTGASIVTGEDGQVFLETFNGAVATIEKNSDLAVETLNIVKQGNQVVTQEATLDLKRGNVVSTLDPTKKNINRYSVKTPKGVAAARGTVFSVKFDNVTGGSVTALTGTVEVKSDLGTIFLPVGGGEPLFLPFGSDKNTTPTPLSEAMKAPGNAGLAAEVVAAVAVVSANVQASTSAVGGGTDSAASTSTAVLAAIVKAATAAVPDQVTAIVKTAISAATSSTSATSGSSSTIAAITEAAVTAAPTQVSAIAQSASSAVVETKVAEAIATAKAQNSDATKAATDAAKAAQEAVAAVAQAAVNAVTAAATAANAVLSDPNATEAQKAAATATVTAAETSVTNVTNAVSTGASEGASSAVEGTGVAAPSVDTSVNVQTSTGQDTSEAVKPPEENVIVTPDVTTKSPQ